MSIPDHVRRLVHESSSWNAWRKSNPTVVPDLSHATLSGIEFPWEMNLASSDLSHADLTGSSLAGADLSHARLSHAKLHKAQLRRANLRHADLSFADLTGCSLRKAILDDADLCHSIIVNANIGVLGCSRAKLAGARIADVEYTSDPLGTRFSGTSVVEWLEADGLDQLHPDSAPFLEKFTTDVFGYIHDLKTTWRVRVELRPKADHEGSAPPPSLDPPLSSEETTFKYSVDDKWLKRMTGRAAILDQLLIRTEIPPDLVRSLTHVNAELMTFLKRNPSGLHQLSWRLFEELVGELLRNFGWLVELTAPSKDGGYDLFAIQRDVAGIRHSWIVECKKYSPERKVGVDIVHALYAIKTEKRVNGAMLATTSDFTKGVRSFKASRYDLDLRAYGNIVEWLNRYRA